MSRAKKLKCEFESVADFAEYLFDDDRTTFTYDEMVVLAATIKRSVNKIKDELESYGLTYSGREVPKFIRGFTANNHNRWVNSGCFGGSGATQIEGFAGDPTRSDG